MRRILFARLRAPTRLPSRLYLTSCLLPDVEKAFKLPIRLNSARGTPRRGRRGDRVYRNRRRQLLHGLRVRGGRRLVDGHAKPSNAMLLTENSSLKSSQQLVKFRQNRAVGARRIE